MEISNTLDVEIKKFGKTVAHVGCSAYDGIVQIKDLFVREKHRGKGLDDVLMEQVQEFAHKKYAKQIRVYCGGPEPFCEDKSIPVEEEMKWYQSHGFTYDHSLYGLLPCMVKTL